MPADQAEEELVTWRYIAEYVFWTVVGFAILIGLVYAVGTLMQPLSR